MKYLLLFFLFCTSVLGATISDVLENSRSEIRYLKNGSIAEPKEYMIDALFVYIKYINGSLEKSSNA